jgi:hypothetical protein
MEKLVEVYVAPDITYAYLVKAHLDEAGIPAQITNENLAGAYSIDGMAPRVLVPKSRVKEALAIVDEMQHAAEADNDDLDDDFEDEEAGEEPPAEPGDPDAR